MVPGGWAKVTIDWETKTAKMIATNSADKEPRYTSIFALGMAHKNGLEQYAKWRKAQKFAK